MLVQSLDTTDRLGSHHSGYPFLLLVLRGRAAHDAFEHTVKLRVAAEADIEGVAQKRTRLIVF
jgi:hypothetical protein